MFIESTRKHNNSLLKFCFVKFKAVKLNQTAAILHFNKTFILPFYSLWKARYSIRIRQNKDLLARFYSIWKTNYSVKVQQKEEILLKPGHDFWLENTLKSKFSRWLLESKSRLFIKSLDNQAYSFYLNNQLQIYFKRLQSAFNSSIFKKKQVVLADSMYNNSIRSNFLLNWKTRLNLVNKHKIINQIIKSSRNSSLIKISFNAIKRNRLISRSRKSMMVLFNFNLV